MEQPIGVPADFSEHANLMFDLQVLAYQADLTPASITFMVGHETSAAAPRILKSGVPDGPTTPLSQSRAEQRR